jgi:hypothetical protein
VGIEQETRRYDQAVRRRATRSGRQTGVWVYIPAHELRAAGFDPHDDPPWYLVRGKNDKGRGAFVNLYDEA